MMQSSPMNLRRAVILVGRLLLAGVFLFAAYSKIFLPNSVFGPLPAKFALSTNLRNFLPSVEQYKVVSHGTAVFVANTLPFVELSLGILLLIGWRVRIWLSVASAMLVGFLSLLTWAFLNHMDIKDCGCFASSTPEPLNAMTLVRDGAFLVFALLITFFAFLEARKPHPWTAPTNS
jgi:methylamine utilization protein MauE